MTSGHDCEGLAPDACHYCLRDRLAQVEQERDKWRGKADCQELGGFLGPHGEPECQGGDTPPSQPMCLTHQLAEAQAKLGAEE